MVVIVVVLLSINRSLSRSTNTGYSNHYPVISHTYYFHIVTLPSSSYFQSLHIPCVTAQLQFPSWLQCLHGSLLFFILLISFQCIYLLSCSIPQVLVGICIYTCHCHVAHTTPQQCHCHTVVVSCVTVQQVSLSLCSSNSLSVQKSPPPSDENTDVVHPDGDAGFPDPQLQHLPQI